MKEGKRKNTNLEISELHGAVDDANGDRGYPGHLQRERERESVCERKGRVSKLGEGEKRSMQTTKRGQARKGAGTDECQGAGAGIRTARHS